jgi:transmembrane sensor
VTDTTGKGLPEDLRTSVREEAAYWDARVRMEACSADERAEFQRWLDSRPEHSTIWASLQQGIKGLQTASTTHPGLRAMRDRAAATRRRAWRTRITVRAAAVAAIAIIGAAASVQWNRENGHAAVERTASAFQTAVGERSSVQLQDGSEVSLDTGSRVEVSYTKRQRTIEVLQGRVYFRVAKDAGRPFVVAAAGRQVVAVGTEFDIRLDANNLFVTLVEGRVDVAKIPLRRGDTSTVQELTPGERMVVDRSSGRATIARADIEKIVSWRQGKILFENTPLAEAIAEMNRYSAAPIVVADPALDQLQVNGMFYTAQPDNFLRALAQYFSIQLRVAADGSTYLSRQTARS